MKVAKKFSLRFVFFLLFVSSCGRMISTTHYQPNEHDVAKVEFDYPSEWNVINLDTTDTYQSIRLEEPGTPTPDFKNPELLPYGYVDIFIEKGTPSELLKIREEIMDFNLRDHIRFDDKVAYERIYIDGYESWKLAAYIRLLPALGLHGLKIIQSRYSSLQKIVFIPFILLYQKIK